MKIFGMIGVVGRMLRLVGSVKRLFRPALWLRTSYEVGIYDKKHAKAPLFAVRLSRNQKKAALSLVLCAALVSLLRK